MHDLIRDSTIGQVLRFLTKNSVGKYIEEMESFELPSSYTPNLAPRRTATRSSDPEDTTVKSEKVGEDGRSGSDLENQSQTNLDNQPGTADTAAPSTPSRSQSNNLQALTKERTIEPRRTNDGVFLVTWYTDDDPENPQNWTFAKKAWVGTVIFFYTFAVYVGSSLYTAGIPDIVRIFGVSEVAASLGLSLYVVGYGIGPLLFSPLSEIPAIGRNPPYIITFVIFVILTVPASLVDNFGGLLVLRFLLGFFGSPCLATGAASYGDFFHPTALVYCITFWGAGATLGPVSSFPPLIYICP